jgi:ubiquinone/menaquinone biosynthesis C-methylase UbiE
MSTNKYSREFYEQYGVKWDKKNRKEYELLASKWKTKIILSLLNNHPKIKLKSLLDYGCGPGNFLINMYRELNDVNFIGVDISSSMINLAKEEFPKGNFYISSDLTFLKNKIDLISFIDVLEHINNPKYIINEAIKKSNYQIIKIPLENGIINKISRPILKNILHPEGHVNFWTKKSFFDYLKNFNIEIIDYYEVNPPKNIDLFNWSNNYFFRRFYRILKIMFYYDPKLYKLFFGSNLFVLTKSK